LSNKDIKLLSLYWIMAYIFWIPVYVAAKAGMFLTTSLTYYHILSLSLLDILYLSALAAIILKRSDKEVPLRFFGLKVNSLRDIFVYSGLAIFPVTIMSFIIFLVLVLSGDFQMNSFIAGSLPTFITQEFSKEMVPIVGIFHWTLSGIISFVLLQAFPYELAEQCLEKKIAFIATFVLWSGLYNGMFYTVIFGLSLQVSLVGEFIDITILGLLFLEVYKKVRSSLGLIIAYVFFYEAPVKASIYYGLGYFALLLILIIGAAWSAVSVIMYILGKLRR